MSTEVNEQQEADIAWAALNSQAAIVDNEISPELNNEMTSEAAVDELSTADLLAPVIKITGDIIAPNWGLNEGECEQLAAAYGGLFDKYMPDNDFTKYGVEITALMTTAIIFGSRRGVPLKEKPPEKISKEEKTTTQADSRPIEETPIQSAVLEAKAVSDA